MADGKCTALPPIRPDEQKHSAQADCVGLARLIAFKRNSFRVPRFPEAPMISPSEEVRMSGSVGSRLAVLGVSALLVSIAAGAAADGLQVGNQAPAFSMVGSDGKTYTLDQFKGKSAVVIAWFPKAFTGGCTKECKSMRESSKQLHELKVAYFTASVDTPELNKKFAESLDLDYPILSDPDKTVANAYGVMSPRGFANRWTFYIDKEGIIRGIDKSVNAPQAGPDIAAKVKGLKLAAD
jgi:peroxiredoxin Q/BCP